MDEVAVLMLRDEMDVVWCSKFALIPLWRAVAVGDQVLAPVLDVSRQAH